jgi:hypothetical protein
MLIHIGGDLQLVREDYTTDHILGSVIPCVDSRKVTPCFIRAQLGPVFSQLAHQLMKDVLRQLESLSSTDDASKFPVVIGTFAVLFMALESLQYHFEKTAYHACHDNPEHADDSDNPDLKLTNEGSDILLRFYKATVCHEQVGTLASAPRESATWPVLSSRHRSYSPRSHSSSLASDDHNAQTFMRSLRQHLFQIKPYLTDCTELSATVSRDNMDLIFDRLLAHMFLMGPPDAL